MIGRIAMSSSVKMVRNLAAIVVVVLWAMPSIKADECTPETVVADCGNGGHASVCVDGACVSCENDAGQCGEYAYGEQGNLFEPFCEAQSGRCWGCTDCNPNGCDPENMECSDGCSGDVSRVLWKKENGVTSC
jgi:hypothetical protein